MALRYTSALLIMPRYESRACARADDGVDMPALFTMLHYASLRYVIDDIDVVFRAILHLIFITLLILR